MTDPVLPLTTQDIEMASEIANGEINFHQDRHLRLYHNQRVSKLQSYELVRERILALEHCLWATAGALMAHEKEISPLVERAIALLRNRLEVVRGEE